MPKNRIQWCESTVNLPIGRTLHFTGLAVVTTAVVPSNLFDLWILEYTAVVTYYSCSMDTG
jgi:hypothetical protein